MGVDFAHLHVHTEYSLLDGFSRIGTLVQQAKALGMRHLAITDHGAMYGAIAFYKACRDAGIHPVLGVEAYLTQDMADRSKRFKDDYKHLLLLAKNTTGYRNLLQLLTAANTEGMHGGKARIDKGLLARYGEGLIATSSCLGGEIPQLLLKGQREEAQKSARWFQDVLGPDNFYLELQDHHDNSPQGEVNQQLYQMHQELHIPLIVTNDLHYVHADDAHSHEVLLCIQTGNQMSNPRRFRFESQEYYLRSPQQMAHLFPDLPDALRNTIAIAEQCEVNPLTHKAQLPSVPIPEGFATPEDYFYHLCRKGAKERYGEITDPILLQLDYEFGVITEKGYVPYFLVVSDYVGWARAHGIRCLARGSAAGSLIAYSLGITNVDPLRYQLLFERFLNPERSDMPDIDMDFPDDRREEVIAYIARTYGEECVAQMVTFSTMAAKGAVRDVARALGKQEIGNRLARLIPTGPKVTIQSSLETVKDLHELYKGNTDARELVDLALQFEGRVRSTSVHAAGVLIGNEPLHHFVPLQMREGRFSTQYEHAYLEELNLIKYDILGLSNLAILDNTLAFIKHSRGEDINLEKLPLDPVDDENQNAKRQKAFDLLSAGQTVAVFQLESGPMRAYIQQLKPSCVEDIMAMVALYRPGPMESIPEFIDAKHGKKKVTYLDPRLKEWLQESYGVIVYQDQVLQIAVNLAGFSWGKVNKFRKSLSKKIMHEVEGYKGDFIEGCVKNGVKREVAEQLFTLILPFGGYGFNKAHAASYAVVAFYCAYLKANYPAPFMAATMTAEAGDAKKIATAILECKRLGVPISGPDVNKSALGFTVENDGVRFGLLAIKGIGENPLKEMLHARTQGGAFSDLADFCLRVDPKVATKGVVETLIRAGAMDSLADGKRHVLLDGVERALSFAKGERQARAQGLISLFGESLDETALRFTLNPNAAEIGRKQLLGWEKELLGIYISHHPLTYIADLLREQTTHLITEVTEELDKQKVTIGGTITEIRRITTKKGETMCVLKIEDMSGTISVTLFPRAYEQAAESLLEDRVVIISGEVQVRGEEPGLLCSVLKPLKGAEEEMNRKRHLVWITLKLSGTDELSVSNDIMKVQDIHQLLTARPGRDSYEILVANGEWEARVTPRENTLDYCQEVHAQLETLLGKGMIEAREMN